MNHLKNMKKIKNENVESMTKMAKFKENLVQQQLKTVQEQVGSVQTMVEKKVASAQTLAEQQVASAQTMVEEQVALVEEGVASAQSLVEEQVSSAQSLVEEQVASAQSLVEEKVASAQTLAEQQVALVEERVASAQSLVEEKVASAQTMVEEQVASVQTMVEEQVALVEEGVASAQTMVEEQVALVEEKVASVQTMVEKKVASTQTMVEEQLTLVEEQVTSVQTIEKIVLEQEYVQTMIDVSEPVTEKNIHDSLDINERHIYTLEIEQENNLLKEEDNSQDYKQKFSVLATLSLELYRMLTSSLLILFVPQNCGGELCTITENLVWDPDQHLYNTGIFFNFLTLFTFTTLYYIEVKRENRLIKYLDVNPNLPMSNEAVKNTLENISLNKKNKILSVDKQYQIISYISICIFALNSLISGIVVFNFYLGSQTTTTLITSLLFMITKLFNIYSISNTEQNIFYSAYMTTRIQFNDLDETHKIIV